MKLKITLAIVITLLPILLLIPHSTLLRGVGYFEWRMLDQETGKLYREGEYSKALLVVSHALKVAEKKLAQKI